ncbi:MAG: helix-turn-helix domain-containing protein [Marmoricola sp.]
MSRTAVPPRHGIEVSAPSGSTRTVERALALLSEVCAVEAISLTACARRADLPASTALRLLRTLETAGFVTRDDEGAFGAGPRMIQLGASAIGRNTLARLATPALHRVVAATGESAYLSIPGLDETAIYIALAEGNHSVRHTSWIGRAVPMEGLAVGRVLRGDVPAAGYVAERDRLEPDVTAIVAPIHYPGGVAGALSVLGPTYRIDDATMQRFGQIVAAEGRSLSIRLGLPQEQHQTADQLERR